MCNIFTECRKTFDEKLNKNRSQINDLLINFYCNIIHKNKNGACCDENNMGSEVEIIACSKDKWKKTCFRWSAFMIYFNFSLQITHCFYGIRF